MIWTELWITVNGALEHTEYIMDNVTDIDEILEEYAFVPNAAAYVIEHYCDPHTAECACVEYLTDHHPIFETGENPKVLVGAFSSGNFDHSYEYFASVEHARRELEYRYATGKGTIYQKDGTYKTVKMPGLTSEAGIILGHTEEDIESGRYLAAIRINEHGNTIVEG